MVFVSLLQIIFWWWSDTIAIEIYFDYFIISSNQVRSAVFMSPGSHVLLIIVPRLVMTHQYRKTLFKRCKYLIWCKLICVPLAVMLCYAFDRYLNIINHLFTMYCLFKGIYPTWLLPKIWRNMHLYLP